MNTLYYGDNLPILREYIQNESIDLVYLDPPFNSNRNYNVLFKDESGQEADAQITAFEDTWHWNETTEKIYEELVTTGSVALSGLIHALRQSVGRNQMMAYLVMMASRLVELHRVLKPTGSLYLHCDSTASHYLKILLDAIFGSKNFQNEIIWKRSTTHSDAKRYARTSDTILFYSKSQQFTWNKPKVAHSESYIESHYVHEENGRKFRFDNLVKPKGSKGYFYELLGCSPPANGWRMPESRAKEWLAEGKIEIPPTGKVPAYKRFLDEMEGTVLSNVWTDTPPVNSQAKDALGYPTQKPLALLERIIQTSSHPEDTVLDPFCGCGTTIAAAQKLGRNWLGIDITHLSIALQKYRLKDMFGLEEKKDYLLIGEPEDLPSARQLAKDDRYQFQWWALSLVKARPLGAEVNTKVGKKGSDKGIDGVITFIDEAGGKAKRVLIQVKSGKVKSSDIRDLRGTIEREGAAIGVFITLENPSQEMYAEAVASGFYFSPGWNRDYPKLQILTISQLLNQEEIKMPAATITFKEAQKVKGDNSSQQPLFQGHAW